MIHASCAALRAGKGDALYRSPSLRTWTLDDRKWLDDLGFNLSLTSGKAARPAADNPNALQVGGSILRPELRRREGFWLRWGCLRAKFGFSRMGMVWLCRAARPCVELDSRLHFHKDFMDALLRLISESVDARKIACLLATGRCNACPFPEGLLSAGRDLSKLRAWG